MGIRLCALAFLTAASLHGQTPTLDSAARKAEVERLDKLVKDEKDPEQERKLWQQWWDLRQEQYRKDIQQFHEEWRRENDPEKKRKAREDLVNAAIQTNQPQFLLEVATDGKLAEREIKIPGKHATALPLHILKSFDPESYPFYDHAAWVIRRMTQNRFELWLPHHGWLFDEKGNVINVAHPPRRDGVGRQWYGAFLPDGRWVTTDIWDYDRTLHFFSRVGKWRKDLAADDLVPGTSENDRWNSPIIGWCRCDNDGRGFVLSVGENRGRGDAWVNADGSKHHRLAENESPWKMCYPRDLEPKGMYTCLSVPNDRGNETMGYTVPGHGAECGYPTYQWAETSVQVLGPGAFGFWPGSSNVYLETVKPLPQPNAETSDEDVVGPAITLFYNFDGTFTGWIDATRVTDAVGQGGMLFRDALNRIVTITPDLQSRKIVRFIRAGVTAEPEKLFPDLRLGFFKSGGKLVLAHW